MANIKKLKANGQDVVPITHEQAVLDSNGVTLDSKLNAINNAISRLENGSTSNATPLDFGVKMIAHRGFSNQAPENTIPAYELAGMHGYWGAECDLQQTSDGHFVLMHDLTVDRTTNGTGNVADMTLEEIKALNIDITMTKWASGTVKVPTLEEYLICCKKYNLVPVIEIKSGLNMENFIRIIREHNMEDKCVVISFSNEILISLRALSNIIKIQTLTFVSLDHCLANNFDIDIDCGNAWLTENNIKEAHSKGIEINVWTVDDSTNMKNLINKGVDYVTTNRLNIINNAHNRVCTLEDNHIKDEMDITTLKSIYTNSVDSEEMKIDYLVRTAKDANYKLLYPEYLSKEGSGFRVRSKAFNAMGCLNYKIQYDDVNYRLTIYPFNSDNLLISDLGWFASGSLISLPKDTKFFVLFCSKVTETTFTDDEITTLMNSIKLTRLNMIKDDNEISEPIHPTVIRYGTTHPFISKVGTESAGSTQNNNRCFDNIKHQIQGDKFIITFDSSKILMTFLPCNNSSYTDLGWLESGKEYEIPTGTQWALLYYKPVDDSATFSTEQQQAVLNSSIKFKGITVIVPSKYQTRTDENLNTESKDIVGAINELNSEVSDLNTNISGKATKNVKNVELNSSIYIPSKIFNLKIGDYKRSFKENVISTYNLDDFRLGQPGDIQYGYYPDYVNISGSSIQLGIYNSRTNELLYSKVISNVVPEIPSNKDIEKNILIIGDSYIDRGFLPCKIKDMLVNDYGFTKLNFIGLNSKTINDVTCLNQGRGGATITDYIKTDNSQGQGWNNPFNFNGNISFTQYCNDNSWDGLDIVIINLGVNDLIVYGKENKSDIKTKLSQLIDYIHADYPNCMIYVNGLIYVHKENNTKNHIIHNKDAMYINSEYEALLSQDKYSSFCRYVDQGFSFLIDYGFSYKKVKAYPNSLEEVKIITDWLHPSELGFDMMAEADVSCILNDFNN